MHLRDFRIGTRLGLGLGIVLISFVGMLLAGYMLDEKSRETLLGNMWAADGKKTEANTMRAALLESAVAMRNIGLMEDVPLMQAAEEKVKAQRKRFVEARDKLSAFSLSEEEKKVIARLVQIERNMEVPFANAMGQILAFNNAQAGNIIVKQIEPLTQQATVELNKLIDLQEAGLRNTLNEEIRDRQRLMAGLFALSLLVLTIGAGISWGITRSITRPLRSAVAAAHKVAAGELGVHLDDSGKDEVSELLVELKRMDASLSKIIGEVRTGTEMIASGSKQIASGNADLSSRTEEQASSLEETASSMEQLTSTAKGNADNARQANQMAVATSEAAVKGGLLVSEVVETMSEINDSSRKVVDIIGVIDGIAFQTNILALNAAVEAARAGEQGRGFAVVAAEVRSLAHRAATAAKEIKVLIDTSVKKVDAGSSQVEQAGVAIREVVESVRRVTDLVAEISAASQEQTAGIEQIHMAISHMDQMTQQNSALVEEVAAASEAMREQAGKLARAVDVFKLASAPGRAPSLKALAASVPASSASRIAHSPLEEPRLVNAGAVSR